MLGIGMPEIIVILVVVLVVFGPKKLPDLAKSIGRGMAEFKKATQDLKASLNMDEEIQEIKKGFDDEMWRTLDKAGPSGADPFKSRQEEMEESRPMQAEDSLNDKEESEVVEQKEQYGQDQQGMNQGGSQADGELTSEPETSGNDKGKEEGIGG